MILLFKIQRQKYDVDNSYRVASLYESSKIKKVAKEDMSFEELFIENYCVAKLDCPEISSHVLFLSGDSTVNLYQPSYGLFVGLHSMYKNITKYLTESNEISD